MRILVVEDDRKIATFVVKGLRRLKKWLPWLRLAGNLSANE
jgi:hypothetical protein